MYSVLREKLSAAGINSALIEREINAGIRYVRFPRALEDVYEAETGIRRRRQQTMTAMLALLFFNLFLFADYLLVPDVLGTAAVVRLLIVSPFTILSFMYLRYNESPVVRESVSVVNAVVITLATAIVMVVSQDPLREVYNQSVLLVIIYATLVQRISFWYAVITCVMVNVIFVVTLFLQDIYDLPHVLGYEMIMFVGTIFTLVAAYNLEREHRLFYLLSLKERLRTDVLETISKRDPLTGLLNRRALDTRLLEMSDAGRYQPVLLSVILLDLDHFKTFNDSLGHQAGDDCLRRVAQIINSQLREDHDLAFRYGGEEFLVLVSNADLVGACRIAERIRRALETAMLAHPANETGPYVTASFGVSHANLATVTPADVIASADIALYAAKRQGRNQVWPQIDASAFSAERAGRTDAAQGS